MGEVFLAQDQLLHRQVAIKEIASGLGSGLDPVAVERLIREARLAAGIQHPNVVAVHDLIVENDQTFIVMEYVEARSLAEMIRTQTALDPALVAGVGSQIAGALEAAHRAGIVHRDVKPSNILIDAEGTAKLADFGVARGTGDANLTSTGMVIGSVAFMAPEVAKGDQATTAADIFSLGCTLYAAVEGHAPFTDTSEPTNSMRTLTRLISETAPPATHAGPLAPLLAHMLNPNPKSRPSAGEAQRQLATTTTILSNHATPPTDNESLTPTPTKPEPRLTVNHPGQITVDATRLVANRPTDTEYAQPGQRTIPPTNAPGEAGQSAGNIRTRRWVLPIAGILSLLVIGLAVGGLATTSIFPATGSIPTTQAPAPVSAESTSASGASATGMPAQTPSSSPSSAISGSGTVLLEQDFSSEGLPAGWTAISGNWKVTNGRLQGTVGKSRARIAFMPAAPVNYRIDVLVRFVKVADASRWLNVGLDYHAGADWGAVFVARSDTTARNGVELAQKQSGGIRYVSNPIGSAPAAIGVGSDHWLAIEVHGSRLDVEIDGTPAFSASNLSRTDGGLGFVINDSTVQFDNVKVTQLAP